MRLPIEDVAVTFETNWTGGIWAVLIAGAMSAIVLVWFGLTVFTSGERKYADPPLWVVLILGALVLVAGFIVSLFPGAMIRHIPVHADTWWVWLPWFLVAIAFVWRGFRFGRGVGRISFWVAGGVIGISTGLGILSDAFTRLAASIPIGVGALALAIVAGAALLVMYSRQRA